MKKQKSFDTWPDEKKDEWREKKKKQAASFRAKYLQKWAKYHTDYDLKNPSEAIKRNSEKKEIARLRKLAHKEKMKNWSQKKRQQKAAIKFFQMTQAVAEIAKIDTTKI